MRLTRDPVLPRMGLCRWTAVSKAENFIGQLCWKVTVLFRAPFLGPLLA